MPQSMLIMLGKTSRRHEQVERHFLHPAHHGAERRARSLVDEPLHLGFGLTTRQLFEQDVYQRASYQLDARMPCARRSPSSMPR